MLLRPSALAMRRIALAGVIASLAIIPTGAAVRLSQSGLGCTDWPKCTAASLVASGASGDPLIHRWVEFGNRMVTALIFVVAVAVFVAAWRFRDGAGTGRGGRRKDLVWLASAQPAGIAAQAVIGGIVVLTKLSPFWVSLHYLATLPVLAAAVALHVRCTEGTGPARPLVQPLVRLVARALVVVTSLMMVAGTLVTGTGPLAGAGDVPRYHFLSLTAVTQLHADIGWVLGTLAVMLALIDPPDRGSAAGGQALVDRPRPDRPAGRDRLRAVLRPPARRAGLGARRQHGADLDRRAQAEFRAARPGSRRRAGSRPRARHVELAPVSQPARADTRPRCHGRQRGTCHRQRLRLDVAS